MHGPPSHVVLILFTCNLSGHHEVYQLHDSISSQKNYVDRPHIKMQRRDEALGS